MLVSNEFLTSFLCHSRHNLLEHVHRLQKIKEIFLVFLNLVSRKKFIKGDTFVSWHWEAFLGISVVIIEILILYVDVSLNWKVLYSSRLFFIAQGICHIDFLILYEDFVKWFYNEMNFAFSVHPCYSMLGLLRW